MRRHRSIHEVDISDLEAALRSDEPGKVYETPQEEIARLRKMELEPQHYDVDINKEVRTGWPRVSPGWSHHPLPSGSVLELRPGSAGGVRPPVSGTGHLPSSSRCSQLSTPDKVLIPERYVELEPESPLSPEEMKEKQKKVERIKTLIAKSR